jgi:hypothetical protein
MKAVIGGFGTLAALIVALILGLLVLSALVLGLTWPFEGGEEQAVRSLVEKIQSAALAGLNRRNPNALDDYFAATTEGAQAAGLAQIQQAYKEFVAG